MPTPSSPNLDPNAAIDVRWNEIPHLPLGTVPEELPDEHPLLYRRIIAKRAIVAAYEDSESPEHCMQDLLADLRHLCDALGLEFAQLDRAAFLAYATERCAAISRSVSPSPASPTVPRL